MKTIEIVFYVIGGMGLFLFGMQAMSDALKRVAGDRLRQVLRMVTRNTPIAVLVGAGVTAFIQSSAATIIMVVGFVNAGMLTLKQAIGVVMGANIGTTATAWIVSMIGLLGALKVTNYALPLIAIGFGASILCKRQGKHWGSVLLGLGLLFLGLSFLKDALEPIGQSAQARSLVAHMAGRPLLAVIVGSLFTMAVQSSSATVAILQLLAASGGITFAQAVPVVFGDNIGTTITAQIAAVGTNVNARRAARAHLVFNVLGVCILLPFVGPYSRFIEWLYPGEVTGANIMAHIALSHTMFNVVNVLIFAPLTSLLAAIVTRLVPGEAGVVQVEPQYLEEHLLATPPIALEQARKEVVRMIEIAASAVKDASDGFMNDDPRPLKRVRQKEDAVDNLQNRITQYLVRLSRSSLSPEEANELPVLMHSVNDIERIGDHAVNLLEAAERKIDGRLLFTPPAMEELTMMRAEVETMFDTVIRALANSDRGAAQAAFESETKLNAMQKQFRESHLTRLAAGDCNFYSGLTFVDCLYYYEKIGDHLVNAAQAVLGDFQWGEKPRKPVPAGAQEGADSALPAAGQPYPAE